MGPQREQGFYFRISRALSRELTPPMLRSSFTSDSVVCCPQDKVWTYRPIKFKSIRITCWPEHRFLHGFLWNINHVKMFRNPALRQ